MKGDYRNTLFLVSINFRDSYEQGVSRTENYTTNTGGGNCVGLGAKAVGFIGGSGGNGWFNDQLYAFSFVHDVSFDFSVILPAPHEPVYDVSCRGAGM